MLFLFTAVPCGASGYGEEPGQSITVKKRNPTRR